MLDRVIRSKIIANDKTIYDLVSTGDPRSSSYYDSRSCIVDSSTDEFDGPSSHNKECWENVRLRPLTILYRLVIYDRQMTASYNRASIDLYEMDRVNIKKEYATMLDRLQRSIMIAILNHKTIDDPPSTRNLISSTFYMLRSYIDWPIHVGIH